MPSCPTDELETLHNELVRSRREEIARNSKLAAEIPDDIRVFCNSCRIETNHSCKAHFKREYLTHTDKYLGGYWYIVGYRFWMCTGCETCILEDKRLVGTWKRRLTDLQESFHRASSRIYTVSGSSGTLPSTNLRFQTARI